MWAKERKAWFCPYKSELSSEPDTFTDKLQRTCDIRRDAFEAVLPCTLYYVKLSVADEAF
jgi:hypothetical protein